MGNRVAVELVGGDPTILLEQDEEAVAALACNNGLPLFWLALAGMDDLGHWWPEAAAALADVTPVPPLLLDWPPARARLRQAVARAPSRWPEAAGPLAEWATALEVLAGGATKGVRLDLGENSGFHPDAAEWLAALRDGVALWHGTGPATPPPIQDPAIDLTGFDALTDRPFPASAGGWQPGRPLPGTRRPVPGEAMRQGIATGLFVACVLAGAWTGQAWAGAPVWGGGLAFALGAAGVWLWARR